MKRNLILKNIKLPIIAFAATGAIYMLCFAVFGFYPFGERSIAWCDLEQQYAPLLMELRGIIRDGGSLLLGKGGGGMNFWGVFLFFISSPLSLLAVFVSEERIIHFINILTVLKLCLGSASASYAFNRLFDRLSGSFNVLFSVMYTVSGYVMMYYQNNMWLDIMIIFPLLLLSMFSLCEHGRWVGYTIFLSVAMLLNFYISYMLVLFIIISFGVMLMFCCERNKRGERAVKFLIADICAAMLTAIIWMPSLKQFTSSGRGESSLDFFSSGSFFGDFSDKAALLLSTSVIAAALVIMVYKRQIFRHGRAAFIGVTFIVMLIGAFIGPINKLWHTGSYQAYPLRYGFIIIFLGLSAAAVLLSEKRTVKKVGVRKKLRINILILSGLLIIVAAAALIVKNSDKLNSYVRTLWLDNNDALVFSVFGIASAAIYGLYIILYRKGCISGRIAAALMAGVMLCESFAGFSVYFGEIYDVSARYEQTAKLSRKIEDESFYRTKCTKRYFYSNMLEGMGYSSIGHYTSLTDRDFLFTAKKLGYSAYWMDISTNGGTLITDAFLMNKYIIGMDSDMNDFYEQYCGEDALKIYRNPSVSDGAVISSVSPEELYDFEKTGRMRASEYMAGKLYGAEAVFTYIKPDAYENLYYNEKDGEESFEIIDASKEAWVSFNINVGDRQELYFDISGNYSTSLTEPYFGAADVYVNDKLAEAGYPNKKTSGIIDLGTFENEQINVNIKVNKNFSSDEFGVFMIDAEKAEAAISSVETADISTDGNRIRITADASDGEYVYIPFAYNKGFSAELNGKKTGISRVFGSFMAVKLEEGANELVLEFYPEGFKAGLIISLLGLIIFAVLIIKQKKLRISERAENVAFKTVILLSAAVFGVVFVLSPIVWIILP